MSLNPAKGLKSLKGVLTSNLGVPGYYFGHKVDRKDDFHAEGETVLLIHGFWQTRQTMNTLERRLRGDGFRVLSFNLGGVLWNFNARGIPYLAAKIHAKLQRLRDRGDFGRLHIIGHSKGGLIGKYLVARSGGDAYTRTLITLGTPHLGTPTALLGTVLTGVMSRSVWQMLPRSSLVTDLQSAFPPQVRLVSVYSRQDLVCPWSYSVVPTMAGVDVHNVPVKDLGHMDLVEDPWVYGLIVRQVAERVAELSNKGEGNLT